jgi:hypothetical protein
MKNYKSKMKVKNNNLLIIADRNKYRLPYGDYLRILAFAPNLGFKKIFFVGDNDLLKLSKEHDFINSIKSSNKKKISQVKKKSFIFNIVNKGKNSNKVFYFRTIINKKKNYKQNMADILNNLSKYFKIKKYKLFTTKVNESKNFQDVYISWKAPINWKIKEYPENKLYSLCSRLEKELGLKITLQKKNETMKNFIKNIKYSKIVISIVNLGCHIANLFDKRLIMLSGPNYHEDSVLNKNQITIFPKKFCDLHKKAFKNRKYKNRVGTLKKNTSKCKCMDNIDENEIFIKIRENLNE